MEDPKIAKGLTDSDYWQSRHIDHLRKFARRVPKWCPDVIDQIVPYLKPYERQRFLELGCEPGIVSASIAERLRFKFYGMDILPDEGRYLSALKAAGAEAKRITSDFWNPSKEKFDVVSSFGLMEHFDDPRAVMAAHDRHLRTGGLLIITIPNFRGLQLAYHRVFDSLDLKHHNLTVMDPALIRQYGEDLGHNILVCRQVGKLRLWGFDRAGNVIALGIRAAGAILVRICAYVLRPILPDNHPSFAPMIVYVARKDL